MKFIPRPLTHACLPAATALLLILLGGCQSSTRHPGPRPGETGQTAASKPSGYSPLGAAPRGPEETPPDTYHPGPRPTIVVKFRRPRETDPAPDPFPARPTLAIELRPDGDRMRARTGPAPAEVNVSEPENGAPVNPSPLVVITVYHPGPRPLVVVVTGPTDSKPDFDPGDRRKVIIVRLPVNIPDRPEPIRQSY